MYQVLRQRTSMSSDSLKIDNLFKEADEINNIESVIGDDDDHLYYANAEDYT